MRTLNEAVAAFKPNQVTGEQAEIINRLTERFESLVESVYSNVPETADRTAGVRKLLEAKWSFVQAITHPTAQNYAKSA